MRSVVNILVNTTQAGVPLSGFSPEEPRFCYAQRRVRGQILGSLGRRLESHHLRGEFNPVEHRLEPAAVEVGRRGVVTQLERQRAPHLQR